MKSILVIFALSIASLCLAGTVERCGFTIPVPDGWRVALGTCTGDAVYISESATFLLGRRRYVDTNEEWVSSGDLYRAERFIDLEEKVIGSFTRDGGSVASSRHLQNRFGDKVLWIDFIDVPIQGRLEKVTCVFVEERERRGVLEIRLPTSSETSEATAVFKRALVSVGIEEGPNQALQTTPMARSVYEKTIEFGYRQRGV